MKRQGGFTLIELVVVIVILGILAVTAAPKFLNLQDDARSSALQGLKGAIDGAAAIAYGKAAIEGQTASTGEISAAGSTLNLVYGYPAATEAALELVVDGLDSDWAVTSSATSAISFSFAADEDNCYVTYTAASDADTPASTTIDADCTE